MNKKLLGILTIGILFTACGSDSESSSESTEREIKQKDFIIVGQNQNKCKITDKKILASFLESTLALPKTINSNTLISIDKEGIQFCENYNRTWDDITCATIDFEEATEKSCIFGFDFKK